MPKTKVEYTIELVTPEPIMPFTTLDFKVTRTISEGVPDSFVTLRCSDGTGGAATVVWDGLEGHASGPPLIASGNQGVATLSNKPFKITPNDPFVSFVVG